MSISGVLFSNVQVLGQVEQIVSVAVKVGGIGKEPGNLERPIIVESSGKPSKRPSLVKNRSALDMVRNRRGSHRRPRGERWGGGAANAPIKALEELPGDAEGIAHPGGSRLRFSYLVKVAIEDSIGQLAIETHLGKGLSPTVRRKPCILDIRHDLDVVLCGGDDVVAISELIWRLLQLLPGLKDGFGDVWLEPEEDEGFLQV